MTKRSSIIVTSLMGILILLCGLSLATLLRKIHNKVERNVFYYYNHGIAAYHRHDYSAYLHYFTKALEHTPQNPELMYHLARAYALQANTIQSLKWLNKCLSLGYYFNAHQDFIEKHEYSDFDSIKDSNEFQALLNRIRILNTPVNNSEIAFKIPEKDLMPEGIAYDPIEQTFYLGSGYKRKIVIITKTGQVTNFVAEEQDGLWNVWGMEVDAPRRILWANSSPWYGMKGFQEDNYGFAGVFKYDLNEKKLVRKYILDQRPILHDFNDLVISSQGDVFITDSLFGAVYVITHLKDELELFIKPSRFTYPNGIALSQDERFLYVAHREGISVVNLATKSCTPLSHPENISLSAVDGLYFYKNSLIGIQSWYRPPRVIQVFLTENLLQVDGVRLIESNNPFFEVPTTGVIINDTFFYIANSQLSSYTEDKNIISTDKLNDIIILKTRL